MRLVFVTADVFQGRFEQPQLMWRGIEPFQNCWGEHLSNVLVVDHAEEYFRQVFFVVWFEKLDDVFRQDGDELNANAFGYQHKMVFIVEMALEGTA